MVWLSEQFPLAFPSSAWEEMFAIPQDVTFITTLDLVPAGASDQSQWVIVAGWECQDLSPAGKGLGLEGVHSHTFFHLLRIEGNLQKHLSWAWRDVPLRAEVLDPEARVPQLKPKLRRLPCL